MDTDGRRQMHFEELPAALAVLVRESIRKREAAGELPALLAALERVDGAGPSPADELLVLHLAGVDIALQVDGRFNGLVHSVILKRTVGALDAPGDSRDPAHSPQDGGLHEVLRARLPAYLDWMYDFISAQLDARAREPREVLGLRDPSDSSIVILTLGEFVGVCHGHLSRWDLAA